MLSAALLLALGLPLGAVAEQVVGVYLFSRHGDRTAKILKNSYLTDLGYQDVFERGTYYRSRYVAGNATNQILGINTDLPKFGQLTASAPYDAVLMPSSQGFLQGLYPPVGSTNDLTTLRNKTQVGTPLNGFQLIPVQTVASGSTSENTAWLQGNEGCQNAAVSSNEYLSTPEYAALLNSTRAFYQNFTNLTNNTFAQSDMTFKNAYTIFDLFNVAQIHNATFDPQNVLESNDNFFQIRTLADQHEFNLAYNASSPIRAIAGSTLAAQVVQALNGTINSAGASKLNIQFGAYGSFQSYFGLANLTAANSDFYGVPDYASSMVWELVTNASTSPFPKPEDISVRFYFHNGTSGDLSGPATNYPLFGQSNNVISWNDFVTNSNKFAVGSQAAWCKACGNSTGVCAPSADSATTSSNGSSSANSGSESGSHLSNAVAGVIGAMVTLGVILGLELLAILIGGLRVVSKRRLNAAAVNGSSNGSVTKA